MTVHLQGELACISALMDRSREPGAPLDQQDALLGEAGPAASPVHQLAAAGLSSAGAGLPGKPLANSLQGFRGSRESLDETLAALEAREAQEELLIKQEWDRKFRLRLMTVAQLRGLARCANCHLPFGYAATPGRLAKAWTLQSTLLLPWRAQRSERGREIEDEESGTHSCPRRSVA
jgi:hypothetical protein